jgi:gamma-glutamyl:cysteine ligase YbdK (ATP-grasp superfamily)
VGLEIHKDSYSASDYQEFEQRWLEELDFVSSLFDSPENFSEQKRVGYELEACLLDLDNQPAPLNFAILNDLDSQDYANELAKYDLEINGAVFELDTSAPELLHQGLHTKWQTLSASAKKFNTHLGLFGVLPNLRPEHFDREQYQSQMKRYSLFSKRVYEMRQESLRILFHGEDEVALQRNDVMSEALCTSLQIHFQVPFSQSVEYYHAALIASVIMVGVSANSSLVLGKRAWHESRIPIFEQSVDSRDEIRRKYGDIKRVHFAQNYIGSWQELFNQNQHFRVILPDVMDYPTEKLYHFNMHNGTIWRWIRPIIGRDSEGKWTLRLELRALPAGPTLHDTQANLWFMIGLIEGLVHLNIDLMALPFESLRDDFYRIAKYGKDAYFHDPKTLQKRALSEWIEQEGIPLARQGLGLLGIKDCQEYIDTIQGRLKQNGATWQLAHYEKHQNISKLMEDYMHHFNQNTPVHRWSL